MCYKKDVDSQSLGPSILRADCKIKESVKKSSIASSKHKGVNGQVSFSYTKEGVNTTLIEYPILVSYGYDNVNINVVKAPRAETETFWYGHTLFNAGWYNHW